MSADRFEHAVADWLQEGPDVAPAGTVEAAVAHAAAHARSHRSSIVRRIRRDGWLLAAAAVVVAVGAAAFSTMQPGRRTAASLAPALVSASETCQTRVDGQTLTAQEGLEELHGRIDICQESASDARASGEMTRRIEGVIFPGTSAADHQANLYGTLELRGPGGTWKGGFVSTYIGFAPNWTGRMTWVALGSGGYRGLVYIATVVADGSGSTAPAGRIEPIADDAVVANTWCWVASATPDMSVENPPQREALRDCLITSDDDRIGGTASEDRTIKIAAGGETEDTGTLVITTVRGTWMGRFSGSGNWYVPGLVSGTLDGGGGLRASRLSLRIYSEDGMRGVLVGEVTGR